MLLAMVLLGCGHETPVADIPVASERDAPTGAREMALQRLNDRRDENGEIPPGVLLQAKAVADKMPVLPLNQAEGTRDSGVVGWTWLGPGNIGGRVRALVIDPTNTLRLFAGGANGGIWRTTNGGVSWQPLNDFLPTLAVSTLAIDPDDPNILYAGTGQSFGAADGVPGSGIFRTVDGGDTWVQLPATGPAGPDPSAWNYVNKIAVSDVVPNLVLAATNSGIWRSFDRGISWAQPCVVLDGANCANVQPIAMDVAFEPGNHLNAVVGLNDGRILRTTNQGLNWSPASMSGTLFSTTLSGTYPAGAPVLQVNSAAGFVKGDSIAVGNVNAQNATVAAVNGNVLTITPLGGTHYSGELVVNRRKGRVALAWPTSSIVYASMNAGGGAIWRSTNSGLSFSLLDDTGDTANYLCTSLLGVTDPNKCQGSHDNAIWAAPDDPQFIVVGGIDLWRDFNALDGISLGPISDWTQYHLGLSAHADQHAIVPHPNYNGGSNTTVFVANDGGVQVTDDIKDPLEGRIERRVPDDAEPLDLEEHRRRADFSPFAQRDHG
jgi:hypothetical protein